MEMLMVLWSCPQFSIAGSLKAPVEAVLEGRYNKLHQVAHLS